MPPRRAQAGLPDLIPLADPKSGFCKRDDKGNLIVTVKNQGSADRRVDDHGRVRSRPTGSGRPASSGLPSSEDSIRAARRTQEPPTDAEIERGLRERAVYDPRAAEILAEHQAYAADITREAQQSNAIAEGDSQAWAAG